MNKKKEKDFYSALYLAKKVGSDVKVSKGVMRFKVFINTKEIPSTLKESYLNLIQSLKGRIPSEWEFNEWFKKEEYYLKS